jgi:hypothetical protein
MKDVDLYNHILFNKNSSILKNSAFNKENSKIYLKGLKYFYGIDCPINYKEAYEIFSKINKELNPKLMVY